MGINDETIHLMISTFFRRREEIESMSGKCRVIKTLTSFPFLGEENWVSHYEHAFNVGAVN
jgi:hypothetical protein